MLQVLLLSALLLVRADPEPEPEPQPEAEPQLYGQGGFNPILGGQGYNPGAGGNSGQGYNPGAGGNSGQGYNPGAGGCGGGTCGDVGGGSGYNPGGDGGQGYNPGVDGGQGYNPGGGSWGLPQPLPQPLPAPLPGGVMDLQPGGGQGYNPGAPGGQCGMEEQCCGMAEQGCCKEQGQKCYTVYERKCRYANKPVCQTMSKEFCDTHQVKSACRYVKNPVSRDITVRDCRPQLESKCFAYVGKEYRTRPDTHTETYTWVNQKLERLEDKNITKCHEVSTCNIETVNKQISKQVPKRECKNIPNPRKVCRSVQVPQPPIEVPTLSYRMEYKRQCYTVNRPVCRKQPCQYNVVQKNVCPTCMEPSYPGQGCGTPTCQNPGTIGMGRARRQAQCDGGTCADAGGQGYNPGMSGGQGYNPGVAGGQGYNPGAGGCGLPVPAGGTCGVGPAMCGQCRQQQVTTCKSSTTKCENVPQEVCQQVPYRVAVPGTRTVQPPPKWEVKCDTVTEMIPQCKVVMQTQTITVPEKVCKPGKEKKCFEYKVPAYNLASIPMNETVPFNINAGDVVDVNKTHCVDLPTRIDCQDKTETRTVNINQVICDQERPARYCHRVPYSYCKNVPGQSCSMEPREVCQPACQQTNYCNQCNQFASTGGFGQCQTSSCPNYIAPPATGL